METRIWHERDFDGQFTGRTIAVIWDGDLRYVGISHCSRQDQFSRKRGRQIAIGRARVMMDKNDPRSSRMSGELGFIFRWDADPNAVVFNIAGWPDGLYQPPKKKVGHGA